MNSFSDSSVWSFVLLLTLLLGSLMVIIKPTMPCKRYVATVVTPVFKTSPARFLPILPPFVLSEEATKPSAKQ